MRQQFVCFCPINVKTAEPNGPGKGHGPSKLKNVSLKKSRNLLYLKMTQLRTVCFEEQ